VFQAAVVELLAFGLLPQLLRLGVEGGETLPQRVALRLQCRHGFRLAVAGGCIAADRIGDVVDEPLQLSGQIAFQALKLRLLRGEQGLGSPPPLAVGTVGRCLRLRPRGEAFFVHGCHVVVVPSPAGAEQG
jgi:hypothetical protein